MDAQGAEPQPRVVRIGSSTAYQLAAQVIALGASFVTSVLIARTLGPEGKGQLSVLQQIPGVLSVLLSLGIASSNFYFVGRRKHSPGTALGNSLMMATLAGVIGAPFVWLMTVGPWAVVPGLPAVSAALAAMILPVTLAASFVIAIGNGLGLLKATSFASMASTAVMVGLVSAAFWADRLSVTGVLAISLVSGLASSLVALLAIRPYLDRVRASLDALRESASYSVKSYAGGLAAYLNYRADILLVGYLAGASAVGIYSIAVTFAELMLYVPNSLATSVLAKTVSVSQQEGANVAARASRSASLLMIVACAAAACLIGPIIHIFYGRSFLPAVAPFLVLLPGVWLLGIARILSNYLSGHGRLYPQASAAAAFVNIGLNLFLIPLTGIIGAALASTISYTLVGVWAIRLFAKQTGSNLREMLFPGRADIRDIRQSASDYAAGLAGLIRKRQR